MFSAAVLTATWRMLWEGIRSGQGESCYAAK